MVERIQARKAPYQPVLVKILGPEKLRVQGVLEPVGPGVITNTGTQAHIQCTHCGVCCLLYTSDAADEVDVV